MTVTLHQIKKLHHNHPWLADLATLPCPFLLLKITEQHWCANRYGWWLHYLDWIQIVCHNSVLTCQLCNIAPLILYWRTRSNMWCTNSHDGLKKVNTIQSWAGQHCPMLSLWESKEQYVAHHCITSHGLKKVCHNSVLDSATLPRAFSMGEQGAICGTWLCNLAWIEARCATRLSPTYWLFSRQNSQQSTHYFLGNKIWVLVLKNVWHWYNPSWAMQSRFWLSGWEQNVPSTVLMHRLWSWVTWSILFRDYQGWWYCPMSLWIWLQQSNSWCSFTSIGMSKLIWIRWHWEHCSFISQWGRWGIWNNINMYSFECNRQ